MCLINFLLLTFFLLFTRLVLRFSL
jgi:hypothetical protein